MCIDGCALPDTILLDVDMSAAGPDIPTQRFSYCIQHASELELYGVVNRGTAVPITDAGANPLPNSAHALYGEWGWKVAT